MPRFAANLTTMFTELPMLDRFGAAARAGFRAVEIQFPYDLAVPAMVDALGRSGLQMVLMNGPPPNYTDRPRGFAAMPAGQAHFQADFRRALRVARAFGAAHLHLMAGVAQGPAAQDAMVANLRWAAAQAPGQSLVIEPINPIDMPGYFLNHPDLALDILAQVAAPNVRLLFDAYHTHRITGDVIGAWDRCRGHVAHVQVAGFPGRHEPAGGEIDYPAFFRQLDAEGYKGWVAAEYYPFDTTEEGLGWLPRP